MLRAAVIALFFLATAFFALSVARQLALHRVQRRLALLMLATGEQSASQLCVDADGALGVYPPYALLRELQDAGLVVARERATAPGRGGRPSRTYRLTDAGRLLVETWRP